MGCRQSPVLCSTKNMKCKVCEGRASIFRVSRRVESECLECVNYFANMRD